MTPPTPLIPGFNPDPSIVRTDAHGYVLVTSTFEYLPAMPLYRSDDLASWELLGHVATRLEQLGIEHAPTGTGVYAPTIRFHDGLYYVVVTAVAGRGNVIFTADDPASAWSDGVELDILGIDPDLAWDDNGTCYVTYSGLEQNGRELVHRGILQARIDLSTGARLEAPRALWSGTGGQYPEAPHLYRIGAGWYLLIAEGGTERGHAVSVARATSPTGPFESNPANPIYTARGTTRKVQCTGHGDLFETGDGAWHLVHLGTWADGLAYRFAPLGRETYLTNVTWVDDWPVAEPLVVDTRTRLPTWVDDFDGGTLGLEWIAIRRLPTSAARIENGELVIDGDGRTMDDKSPTFVGRRVTRVHGRISAMVAAGGDDAIGGLSLRYDEWHHLDLELQPGRVVARIVLPTIRQEQHVGVGRGAVELAFEMRLPHPRSVTSDLIDLVVVDSDTRHVLMTVDGRYLSAESTGSFVGRVAGAYCETGQVRVARFEESDL